jgi:hypothetical protein
MVFLGSKVTLDEEVDQLFGAIVPSYRLRASKVGGAVAVGTVHSQTLDPTDRTRTP